MLLYSPAFARGWNALLGEVRDNLSVPKKLPELAMSATAALTGAAWEYERHAAEYVEARGREDKAAAIRRLSEPDFDASLFDPVERDVLELAAQMTRNVAVEGRAIKRLRAAMRDRHVVELVGIVACFNMVARFFLALDIG
jgi:alkylhydroperoxidase family enzyme